MWRTGETIENLPIASEQPGGSGDQLGVSPNALDIFGELVARLLIAAVAPVRTPLGHEVTVPSRFGPLTAGCCTGCGLPPLARPGVAVEVPQRMGGVPWVRDHRFPVATVVAMVAEGMTVDEIVEEHPDLDSVDVVEALRVAALAVQRGGLLRR